MTQTLDWLHNDELLKREIATGHRHALLVGARLREAGLEPDVTEPTFRATLADRHAYRDEADIVVNGHIIECKSRKLIFQDYANSYPFPTAFVDTESGWENKATKPTAVVLVSQKTQAMLVIPASTAHLWERLRDFDRTRNIEDTWLAAPRHLLRPMEVLVQWLLARA